jgi:dipeptidyl aminopeptidase/acylaminoacyl peptidase
VGHSYGGYAALTGLYATPGTYACGISIGGPTDLASLIESFPPYWKVDLSIWHDFVGNPRIAADRQEMTRRSPLTRASSFDRPVLLIHGERDVRVRVDQSLRMARALEAAGKPVRLVTIPEMGHMPSWWAHQYRVLRETEDFLAGCLGTSAPRRDWHDPLVWLWSHLSR